VADETVEIEHWQYLEIVAGLSMITGVLEEMHATLKELRDGTKTGQQAEANGTQADYEPVSENGSDERTNPQV
jgi:hypothetical protein